MKRGDLVVVVFPGHHGKPRPGLIVQNSQGLAASPSLTLCPVTSDIIENARMRVLIDPAQQNGLRFRSQIQVDKIQTVERRRIRETIGTLSEPEMSEVDLALAFHLNLYAPATRETS